MFITSPDINRFSKSFHCYIQQEISNETVIKDFSTPYVRRYTTLGNISFQKLHWPKAQQWQTRRACTEENVAAVDELELTQYEQPQTHHSARQLVQSGVVRNHFFTAVLIWKV